MLNSTYSLLRSQFQKTIHLVAVVYFLEPDRDSENLAWCVYVGRQAVGPAYTAMSPSFP